VAFKVLVVHRDEQCQRPNFLKLRMGGLKIPNILGQIKKGSRMMNKF
jgi:hypothetical protein